MTEIKDLKKQIAQLKKKSELNLKKAQLKAELKALTKAQRIEDFDKKHKVLRVLGRLGEGAGRVAGRTIGKVAKVIATPPSPAQQKAMDLNQKRLKKLLEMP